MSDDQTVIRRLEERVDAALGALPLDVDNLGIATWHLLTATEDAMRLPLIMPSGQFDVIQYMGLVDLLKYGLKHALSTVVARSYKDRFAALPTETQFTQSLQAGQLVFRGMEYQAAVGAFSAYHAGANECLIANGELEFRPVAERDIRLRARDMLEAMAGAGRAERTSPLAVMINWLRNGAPAPIVQQIKKTASVHGDTVLYADTPALDARMYTALQTSSDLIPADWNTSYGGKIAIESVFRAIVALHAKHCLIVNTVGWSRQGGCAPSIVLAISRQDLMRRIHALVELPLSQISAILDILVYGSGGVNSPDPALQPFFAVDTDLLLSAPLFICGSDMERNFLTLLTRVDKRLFDAASHAFEDQMIARMKASANKPEWHSIYNRTIPVIRSVGEIDCLLLDAKSRTILLLELWWQIPPGEAREVTHREELALTKAKKTYKKLTAVRSRLSAVLSHAGIPTQGDWSAHALLVSESFLPSGRNPDNIPVISRRVLQGLLSGPHARLSEVWSAIQAEVWLPTEGAHYTTSISHCTLGGVSFSNLRLIPTLNGVAFAYLSMYGSPPLHVEVE